MAHAQRAPGRAGQVRVARDGHHQPLALAAQQAVLLQLPQALADGGAVYAEAGRQVGLGRKGLAFQHLASHDALAKVFRDDPVGRHGPEFFNVHQGAAQGSVHQPL
jgi:hypothetical protein